MEYDHSPLSHDVVVNADDETDGLGRYLDAIGQIDLLTAEQEVQLAQQIEQGRAADEKLAMTPDISYDDRVDLQRQISQAEDATTAFVNANLRWVVTIATSYQHRGMSLDDLIGEGNEGLMKAVPRFDWRKGYRFSTYATPWIRKHITRALAKAHSQVHVPISWGERRGSPAAPDVLSLDRELSPHTNVRLGDIIPDNTAPSPEDHAIAADERARVRHMLQNVELSDAERISFLMRHGFYSDGVRCPLREIGERMGCSRESSRKLEVRARTRLALASAQFGLVGEH